MMIMQRRSSHGKWLMCLMGLMSLFTFHNINAEEKKDKEAAQIQSPDPAEGFIGDPVHILARNFPSNIDEKEIMVYFGYTRATSLSPVKRLPLGDLDIHVSVPEGASSGSLYVALPNSKIVSAGFFKILRKKVDSVPETGTVTAPRGRTTSSSSSSPTPTPQPPAPPTPPQKTFIEDMDLPIAKPDFGTKIQTNAPPINPKDLGHPQDPPTFMGVEIKSESYSIVYVIDRSGSMDWDENEYTDADGNAKRGNRMDRAKAALVRSIRSLTEKWKFNIVTYDCSIGMWRGSLVVADEPNKSSAINWVMSLSPDGGTMTGPTTGEALFRWPQNRLVVLLTDGDPNCGVGDLNRMTWQEIHEKHRRIIKSANRQGATVHVFGISATGFFKQFLLNVAADNSGTYTDVH